MPWSIRRLAGSILGMAAMLSTVNGVLIVKSPEQDQPGKQVKLMRAYNTEDFVKLAGIEMEQIPERLSLEKFDPFELCFLPSDFYSHISQEQLEQLLGIVGLEKLLNVVAPYPKRCKNLFERFGTVPLKPSPDIYPNLDSRIFKYLDPWTTIISGALTQEQYISLINYNSANVEDGLKAAQLDALSHSLTLLHRTDLDLTELACAIGSNANALQEVGSVLPEVTNQRLNLLVMGYREYTESQKRQSL